MEIIFVSALIGALIGYLLARKKVERDNLISIIKTMVGGYSLDN